MTWMVIRLVLSLAFVAAVLLFASRLAKKRGLGGASELIEVVARQRMGRASSVTVLRVAGRVLVVGATDAQVTLLAEVEDDELQAALAPRSAARAADVSDDDTGTDDGTFRPARPARSLPAPARGGDGALAGSVLDKGTWTTVVQELRDRTVRRT